MSIRQTVVRSVLPRGIVAALQANGCKETHINRALSFCRGSTYVEIGVREGDCFRQIAAARKVGVDPSPLPTGYVLASGESFHQMTSDEFFASDADQALADRSIDVALVDGMHEYVQTLRDVMNLERLMSPRGTVFIHDCNPKTRARAEDSRNPESLWNGDVWKVAYYLRTHRPDLRFFTLDCDFGLGVLTGFGGSQGLRPPAQNVVAQVKDL